MAAFSKRFNSDLVGPPVKKSKILDEEFEGDEQEFTINEEYARRFEHNKKRVDLQRLEEKYGKGVRREEDDEDDEDSDSEDSEDEDDIGELVTEDLDADIAETLNAIRNKDPRVYDKSVKFFKEIDEATANADAPAPKEKSMTLKDYHRINLLNGGINGEEDDTAPKSYMQEQDDVKSELRKAMHGAAEESDEEDGFFKAKSKPATTITSKVPVVDLAIAEREPETYLSNFFAAKAWIPAADSRFAHLGSDDEDEDVRAEQFEAAYNLRFEDPDISNKTLVSHARDAVEAFSVRREEKSGRARARELKRLKKEEEKAERDAEKVQLRKLQIEKMEEKVDMIRKAAGGRDIDVADWANVLEDDFDDSKFDEEMRKRFGDDYYQAQEAQDSSADEEESSKKKRKVKKPKWDDDIDIKDLVPDFKSSDSEPIPLSDSDSDIPDASDNETPTAKQDHKSLKQAKALQKSQSRRDRRIIETLVDQSLSAPTPKGPTFRYRDTSPTNFGLSTLDILAADDRQLNEFVGLKKLATFRDQEKKTKDRRKLGKKARLREWRKETFGKKEGPGVEDWFVEGAATAPVKESKENGDGIVQGERRKKRKRGGKKKDKEVFEV